MTIEGIARIALLRSHRNAGEAQQRQNIRVVPLERDREGHDVELTHRRLRLERHDLRARGEHALQLFSRRQEEPLADDVGLIVEEAINGLEAEVGHPDEVGVRERERDAQAVAVRLLYVADFA